MSKRRENIKQHLKSEPWTSCLFFSIGINSFLPHFRLAYQLNKSFGLKLIRDKKDLSLGSDKVPFYTYVDSESLEEWFLFPNRVPLEVEESSKSLGTLGFYEGSPTHYLSNMFKEAEVFLVCKNPFENRENQVLSKLKQIEGINFSFLLDQKRFASSLELNFL